MPLALGVLGLILAAPKTLITTSVEQPAASWLLSRVATFAVGMVQIPLSLTVAAAYGIWASETDPSTWPPLGAATATASAGPGTVDESSR